MGAMRLYSPQELVEALTAAGAYKTDVVTNTAEYWVAKDGTVFSIPEPDETSGMHSQVVFHRLMDMANGKHE